MPTKQVDTDLTSKNAGKKRRWKVKVQSLTPGAPLSYDLYDDLGKLLVPAGKNVSQAVIDYMLQRGLKWLLIDSTVDVSDPTVVQQTRPYDPQSLALVNQSFESCASSLDRSVASLMSGGVVDVKVLESALDVFAEEAQNDVAVVLATVLGKPVQRFDLRNQLVERSVRLAGLAVSMAVALDQSLADIRAIGIAGLLSDIALLDNEVLSDIENARGRLSAARNFLQHPIRSSEMTINLKRVPPLSRLLITQVHEELDGHGFPLGISAARIHPLAKILTVADAFLAMTEPIGAQYGILPADAMASLIYHSGEGRLCARSVQALVQCASVYPVTSKILLENDMKAQVVRACPGEPLKPAVVIEGEPDDIVDLRCCPVRVLMPLGRNDTPHVGRLRMSKLSKPIWQSSAADFVIF